jgi:hypothetical protein
MEKGEQDIEHSHHTGQPALDVGAQAMMHALEATNDSNH